MWVNSFNFSWRICSHSHFSVYQVFFKLLLFSKYKPKRYSFLLDKFILYLKSLKMLVVSRSPESLGWRIALSLHPLTCAVYRLVKCLIFLTSWILQGQLLLFLVRSILMVRDKSFPYIVKFMTLRWGTQILERGQYGHILYK